MATDYDAPRVRDGEEEKSDTIVELDAARSRTTTNLLEDDTEPTDGLTLPGADLSDVQFEVRVIPKQADEFTCMSCFLVSHVSQETKPGTSLCRDCA